MAKFIDLSHGVVEDAGDDSAMAVAGGARIALAQAEFADERLTAFVQAEFQTHAVWVVHTANEAVVLLHLDVAGVVALRLFWILGHGHDFSLRPITRALKPQLGAERQDPCEGKKLKLLSRLGFLYTYRFRKPSDWSLP